MPAFDLLMKLWNQIKNEINVAAPKYSTLISFVLPYHTGVKIDNCL